MTPVIKHLRTLYPELPSLGEHPSLNWTFTDKVKKMGPEFYSKIVPIHPILNIEYSILCHQLRHNFSFPERIRQDQVIEQLTAALMMAELLEQLNLHYLDVPREVARLRRQQHVYRSILVELTGESYLAKDLRVLADVEVGLSLTQQIRENTAWFNWFRLLLTRGKRVLNFLDLVGTGSESYRRFMFLVDLYTNPVFAYLAWVFFIPRFTANIFLVAKHTLPFWLDEEELALGWRVRLLGQLQRRWFELGNDSVWVTVGLLNCFVFVGPLAAFGVYFTLFAFAFDVANTSFRAYLELNRLYKMHAEYTELYHQEQDPEARQAIKDYQNFIKHRVGFEQLRLGLTVAGAIAVFIAMSLAVPAAVVFNPLMPLVGAILLILIWTATFTLTLALEHYRPNDNVEKPAKLSKIGFFAPKPEVKPQPAPADSIDDIAPEDDFLPSSVTFA